MSLFDNLDTLGFTEDEINEVNKWRKALREFGREGQAIDRNCEIEKRVEDDIRAEFLLRIITVFKDTGNPMLAIQMAVSKAIPSNKKGDSPELDCLLLKGKNDNIRLPQDFIRLVGYYSLLYYFMEINYQIASENDAELRDIKIEDLPDEYYYNDVGILWSSNLSVDDLMLSINELCCRLGLRHLQRGELVYKMKYSSNLVSDCRFPTIVEARNHPCFQPANDNLDAGRTRDLRNNCVCHPEWVHGPIKLREVETIKPIDEIPNIPIPDGYLNEKLALDKETVR
jgi:hypothetical protein